MKNEIKNTTKNNTPRLPAGWEIKKLGEVIKLEYGKPLEKSQRKIDGKYPVYGANGIKSYSDKYYFDKKTIVVGRKGSAGEINLTEEKFWPLDVTYFILFDETLVQLKFLFFLLSVLNIPKLAKGVKPGINRNDVYNLSIPLPPLPEQKRIVAILDKCFAVIERSRNNAEQNLKNAKELFESYLQGVFENKGSDWEIKKLGEVCEFFNGKAHEKIIDKNGKYIVINSKFISSNGSKYKKTNKQLFPLVKKDIVFVMSDVPNGKALAKCFLVDKDNSYTLNQRIGLIRSNNFDVNYLFYHFNRHKYLLSFNNGENQTNLRKNDILNCPLIIPPLPKQKRIVAQLDALQAETKKLENIYRQKIANLEELKKSILQKAFSGELTEKEITI